MSDTLPEFVAAGPPLQRPGTRLLLFLARRPRGRRLLAHSPQAERAALSLVEMARYDDPQTALRLGFDAEFLTARGRELRRAEGRP